MLNLNIKLGNATYHHVKYVANICDPFILGLDFLKENHFKLDFKYNELPSKSEQTDLFKNKNTEMKSIYQIIEGTEIAIHPRTATLISGTLNENNSFRFGLIE